MRAKIFSVGVAVVFLFLGLSLFRMQLLQGGRWRDLSNKNCIRLIPQMGMRGNIVDRNGVVIVGSVLTYDAAILSQESTRVDQILLFLSRVTGVSLEQLRKSYRKNYSSPSMPVTVIRNIDRQKAAALEEMKLDIDSLIVQQTPVRYYPYGRLASHVVGYLSEIDHWRLTKLQDYGYKTRDIVGFGGIEEKYDYYLRQEDGGLSVEVDHRGRFTRVLGFRPPLRGKDIQLTIDWRVQKMAEDALEERKGAVVILDPNSGEVIACASAPDFDPSVFVKKSYAAMGSMFNDSTAPLMNRAISGTYPPASVFKLVGASAGLETARISRSTEFYCPGSLQVGSRDFKCWDTHGEQDLIRGMAHSCDVFFYRVGLAVGGQNLHDYALKLGMGKPTGIELPYESSGNIPDPFWKRMYKFQRWYDGDTANMAIGQGALLTSPLQICRLMAIFANGGNLVTPYIIKAIDGQDVSARHKKIFPARLRRSTVEAVRASVRAVVSDSTGTGSVLANAPVSVAGKTGTAETSDDKTHAWFAGFFPFERPRYAICVFLERGGHGYSSSILAKRIIDAMQQERLFE
ncbi:MAG: penicillin-binding protein 2 [Candidatus Omnitrophota bacterium]